MKKIYFSFLFFVIGFVANAQTTTFNYTGAVQTYTVPAGISSLYVDLAGAKGGDYVGDGLGGWGGRVLCTLAVSPGQVLQIYVGQAGTNSTGSGTVPAGGSNSGGGAQGGNGTHDVGGAAGGGSTDIRTTAGGTGAALSSRLVVGGGGGGGAWDCGVDNGGVGGGLTGGTGTDCGAYNSATEGTAGTQTAGGLHGTDGAGHNGANGVLGKGGNAYNGTVVSAYGGGGGGGYYGGGGAYSGGGSGGSSFYGGTGVSGATTTSGYNNGNGYVNITPLCSGTPSGGTAIATVTSGCGSYNSVLSLTGASAGSGMTYQWQSSPDGTTWTNVAGATADTLAVTVTAGVYYQCVLTCSLSSLSGTSSSINLTYNPNPSLISCSSSGSAGGPFALCYSTTGVSFTDSLSGGTWSNTPTTVGTINASTGLWTPSGSTGTTTISYTIGTCSATVVLTINNSAAPSTPTLSAGTNPLCVYTSLTLTDATAGGIWSSGSPTVATVNSTTGVVSAVGNGTASITYNNGCGSATYVVTVHGSSVTLSPTTGVACYGTTLNLTATFTSGSGSTYSWSGPGGTSTTTSLSISGVTPAANGIYTFTTTTTDGCTETFTLPITILNNPSVTVTPSTSATICLGASSSFSASATITPPTIPMVQQNFNSGLTGQLGGLWVITNGAGNTSSWWSIRTSPGYGSYVTGDGSNYMEASPDALTTNTTTKFTSPAFSTVGYDSVSVSFNYYFDQSNTYDVAAEIDYSIDGGTTWSILHNYMGTGVTGTTTWTAGTPNSTYTLPSTAMGHTNVKIRWNYNSTWGFWWAVDNIDVFGYPHINYNWSGVAGATGLSCTACASTTITPTAVGANVYDLTTTALAACTSTTPITVNVSAPGAITGSTSICLGGTSTLSDTTVTGTWSSSNPTIASVGSTTGVVTGNALGTATITFTNGLGCYATKLVTVNTSAPATITGPTTVCIGGTITLADATGGGSWSSSSTSTATVGSTTGIVTGVATGTVTISYTTPCGTTTATITVNGTIASITGTLSACVAGTTSLADATAGGTWTSGSTSTATVGSTTGVVTGVAAGTVNITYTSACGTTSSVVTVNGSPASITGTPSVCAMSVTTLADATVGGTWSSGATSIATVDPVGDVTGVGGGTAVISYSNGCGTPAMVTVTVSSAPSGISGTGAVCIGSTLTLTDVTTGGTWSSGSTSIATVDGITGIVTGVSAGTALISYNNGCGTPATTTVTVNGSPSAITGAASVCVGSITTLADLTAGGIWSSGTTTIATVDPLGDVTGVAGGTAVISYSNGCGTPATMTLTVNAAPTPISGTPSVCVGSIITLSESSTGGTWSSSATSVATVDALGDVTGIAAGTAIISYANGCGSAATITVTVNSAPATITGAGTVCAGSVITLADATSGGVWSSGATAIATVDIAGNVTGVSGGTAVISYSNGCGTPAMLTVTVDAIPTAIIGSGTVCAGSTITLSEAATGGSWSSSATSIATVDALGDVTGVTGGTTVISYANGCGSPATATVTVSGSFAAITGTPSVCIGGVTSLADAASGGIWSSGTTTVATVDAVGNVTGVSAGTTTISYSTACGAPATMTVTVNAVPATISGTPTVCAGSITTLSESSTGGTWSSSATSIATVDAIGDVSGVTAGTSIITYSNGCGSPATLAVTVIAAPASITGISSVCVGSAITLLNTVTGGTWSSGTTAVATVDVSGVVTGASAGTSTITYSTGCGTDATMTVTVNAAPATISGTPTVCAGSITTLSESSTGGTWSSSATSIGTVDAIGDVSGISAGTSIISYSNGCGSPATLTVTVIAAPATISGTTNVCIGNTITLTETTAGGTWSSSATAIASIDISGDVSGISAGVATITYATGCGSPAISAVTVVATPTSITGVSNLCVGNSLTLADAVSGGTWSSSGLYASVIGTSGVVTGLTSGIETITYANGCGSVNAVVTVVATPTSISGASSLCTGSSITLTDSTTGGSWSSSATAIASVDPISGVVSGITAGISTITYSTGCGSNATLTLTVYNTPATISGVDSVCAGSVTILSDATSGGTWNSSATSIATVDISGNVNGLSAGTTIINYVTSCGTVSVTITVNAMPSAISGANFVCAGSTTVLNDATTGGSFSSASTAIATVNAATGLVMGIAAGTTQITYTPVTGCLTSVSFTVNPMPVAGTISGVDSICVGSTTTLTDLASGGTIAWSNSNNLIATLTGGAVTGVSAGLDTVSYSVTNSCGTATTSVIVTVNPLPNAGVISGSNTICVGATSTLTETITGGSWSSSTPTSATIGLFGDLTGIAYGTTNIIYTYSNSCGTAVSAPFTISVDTLPSNITGPGIVCVSSTITLNDVSAGGSWSSSNTAVASVDAALGVVTGVGAGVVNINYTTLCGIVSSIVTVNGLPSTITGASTICSGTSTTLGGATGGSWSSSSSCIIVDPIAGVVTGGCAGTATITATLACGSSTFSITVYDSPAPISGVDSTVCVGGTLAFSDLMSGGTWTSSNISIATVGSTTGTVTGVAPGYDTVTYSTGCGVPATRWFKVISSPDVITGSHTLCADSVIILYDAASSGVWSGGTTGIATINPVGIVTGMSAGTTNVTYSTGCGSPATAMITVNPLPPAITGPSSVCQFASLSISDSGTGTWSSSNPSVASVAAGTLYGVSFGVATITWTLSTGCATVKTVSVNPFPTSGFITGTTVVCQGSTTTLTDTAAGGTGSWSSHNLTIATVASGVVSGLSAGIDTIAYSVTNFCGTGIATKIITVNPLPMPGTITGASSICLDSTLTLTHIGTAGVWSSTATSIATVNAGGVVRGLSVGMDSIKYTVTNSCGTNFVAAAITVLGVPGTITGLLSLCDSTTDSLFNGTAGGTWSSSDLGTVSIGIGNGVATGVSPGVVTISYSTGCGSAATANITVNALPNAGIITGSGSVCTGLNDTLHESVSGGMWSTSNSNATVSSTTGIVTAVSAGIDTIIYASTTPSCGTRITEKIITINPSPDAGILFGSDSVCVGTSITISASAAGGVWTMTNGDASVLGGVVAGTISGIDTLLYTVTSAFCGSAVATMIITVEPHPVAGTISGDSSLCVGSTISLSETIGGGTWSSNTTSNATVSTGGVVTGVSAGADTIFYSVTNYCGTITTTQPITVNPMPDAGIISGLDSVCQLATITLSESVPSGTWGITNSNATDTLGVISGLSTGFDTVKYTVSNICGAATATYPIFIKALPTGGSISGDTSVCSGNSVLFTESVSGGIWSSYNTAVAAVSAGGNVTGVTAGVDTIYYTVSNTCGSVVALHTISVDTLVVPTASGGSYVCMGSRDNKDTLIGVPVGGIWSSSNPMDTITDIGSGKGLLAGGVAGYDTLVYTVTNVCGSNNTNVRVLVFSKDQCDSFLSVNTVAKQMGEIKVYPNPSTGSFIVQLSETGVPAEIEILDVYGKVVARSDFKTVQEKEINFNLNYLTNGTYFIKVNVNEIVFRGTLQILNK